MSLEAEKHNIEINMSSLHGQLNQQQEEFQQIQQKLSKKSNDLEDTKNSLKNALDRNEQLTERLSGMEKKNHLDSEFEVKKSLNFSKCFWDHLCEWYYNYRDYQRWPLQRFYNYVKVLDVHNLIIVVDFS